jgi:cytochrome b561
VTSYDGTTIRLHWATALLVVALWILGQTAGWFPRGPIRGVVWSTHFTLGALLAFVYVYRLVWRFTEGRRLPGVGAAFMAGLAKAGHGLLYLGILAVIVAGIGNLYAHGSSVWGIVHFPKIADETLRHNIAEAHEWLANLLLIAAAGHAAIALVHQYVWRDGVLGRMWPSLAR